MTEKFDSVVIGGGPGGYVCAIRLAQLGQKTACIEARGALGGTCLNIGCIPSKSLLNLSENFKKAKNFSKLGIETGDVKLNLDKMMKNKEKAVSILTKGVEFLFKKNKVTYLKGFGSFISDKKISVKGEDGKKKEIEAKNIIIATGSEAMPMPNVEFDEKTIVSSTGALSLKEVPKSLVVVGGGYIGLEMGSFSLSYEITVGNNCTSFLNSSGNKGLIGLSINLDINVSLSVGLASLLKYPPGIFPPA